MADVHGELRDGKYVCWWRGCKELAVLDEASGLFVACPEHAAKMNSGEQFPICPMPSGQKFVKGVALVTAPRRPQEREGWE